ncbi:DUF4186 domain-containing protein [Peribacillus frigoritolerans]|uniref:DUF4186 domain-containing protein n=1 Tax=Peribacillus frigoritolerans TaxID=450367 RepID=UPI0021D25D53|nr:DUF4186 domain-containing protein [Peribacillus frigoritolerans]MCU6603929.1 DUF4186 domain-containing protein [Peribacillus frigoritolerans]
MNDWSDEWKDDDSWKQEEEKKIKVKCTDADCESDLHCFLSNKKLIREGKDGLCRYCGVDLVDWDRVRRKEINDEDYLFKSLKYEFIRHHLWHVEVDQKAINHAKRKGKVKMEAAVINRIEKSIKGLPNGYDGRQTPFEGNVIYYAQHATATCCRKCIKQWHGIPTDRELNENEVSYFKQLILDYINERMPDLTEEGEKVPPLRK